MGKFIRNHIFLALVALTGVYPTPQTAQAGVFSRVCDSLLRATHILEVADPFIVDNAYFDRAYRVIDSVVRENPRQAEALALHRDEIAAFLASREYILTRLLHRDGRKYQALSTDLGRFRLGEFEISYVIDPKDARTHLLLDLSDPSNSFEPSVYLISIDGLPIFRAWNRSRWYYFQYQEWMAQHLNRFPNGDYFASNGKLYQVIQKFDPQTRSQERVIRVVSDPFGHLLKSLPAKPLSAGKNN